jgi:hypothetical protein
MPGDVTAEPVKHLDILNQIRLYVVSNVERDAQMGQQSGSQTLVARVVPRGSTGPT